jgi:hypothetical protein
MKSAAAIRTAVGTPDPPTCSECCAGYLGGDGVFCRTFREVIFDERVAAECEAYDPRPQAVPAREITG